MEAAQDYFLTVNELDVETDPNGFANIDEITVEKCDVAALKLHEEAERGRKN